MISHMCGSLSVIVAAILTVLIWAGPSWALGAGAPPVVTFAGVWVNTVVNDHFPGTTDGVPQLFASIDLRIPGGSILLNVQSVTVTPPGGVPIALFKDTGDLFPEISHFRNLTADAGVAVGTTGTYTFTVTDTAGGVTTTTDDLAAPAVATPTASIALSGSPPTGPAGGQIHVVDLASNPTPTVTWQLVAGAVSQRVRIRTFDGPDVFSRGFGDGTTTSTQLPAGVMVPGRIYNLLVEAEDANFLPNSNARVRRVARIYTQGPDIILSSTGSASTGGGLTINARVTNDGPAVTADVSIWIGVPTGQVFTIFEQDGVTLPAGLDVTATIFSRAFDGSEPTGNYVVGIRLVHPALGETMATQSRTFSR